MTSHANTLTTRFHQETKYAAGDMEKFQVSAPVALPPPPFKDYQSERTIDLVGYLPFARHPFTGGEMPEVPDAGDEWGISELSRLLYFTNGVTAMMSLPDGSQHYLRAAPSAGAVYPTEIYLVVQDVAGLPDGVYSYQVRDHSLVPVWEGQSLDRLTHFGYSHNALVQANAAIVLTGVWGRGFWRYQERAYRRALLDTGHVLGNLSCVAPGEGFAVFPVGGFADAAVSQLLLLDTDLEGPLTLVALPRLDALNLTAIPTGNARSSASASAPAVPPQVVENLDDMDIHLHQQLHQAGCMGAAEPPPPPPLNQGEVGDAVETDLIFPLEHEPLLQDQAIEQILLQRRSARGFVPGAIDAVELGACLSYAYHTAVPALTGRAEVSPLFDPGLLDTYVLVSRVDGIPAGIYHYAPGPHALYLDRDGDFSGAAQHICLGQALGGNAALLVIHTANLDATEAKYGDRGYRYLHMDAGHLGQRLNLAAVTQGVGVTGVGGFYDDDTTRLLGLSDAHGVVYITALGVPIPSS